MARSLRLSLDCFKERLQFWNAVNLGTLHRFFHPRQCLFDGRRWALQDLPEKKPQTADGYDEGTDRHLLLPQEKQKVVLDFVIRELIGRPMVEPG